MPALFWLAPILAADNSRIIRHSHIRLCGRLWRNRRFRGVGEVNLSFFWFALNVSVLILTEVEPDNECNEPNFAARLWDLRYAWQEAAMNARASRHRGPLLLQSSLQGGSGLASEAERTPTLMSVWPNTASVIQQSV